MVCNTLRMKAESSTMSTRILLPFSIMSATFLSGCRCFSGCRSGSLPDQAGDRGNELVLLNWFCHKGACAFFHGAVAMFRSSARCHYHDGNAARLRILPQVRKQLIAVRPWHFQVGYHQIATRLRDDLQSFQSVRSKLHAVARLFQHTTDKLAHADGDRKSTRLNSSHSSISYAVFCLKQKNPQILDRVLKLTKSDRRRAQ